MKHNIVLPGRGERVLCAVSGGLDSMCLLHMLTEQGAAVTAAHFNHQIRGGAADADEAFVRDYCRLHAIPFAAGRGDVTGCARREGRSLEEAARLLRYRFLRETAAAEGGIPIYTAHHAGDAAETVLLNLIRGTGIAGLTGIGQQEIRRPLLSIGRTDLEAYALRHGVPHIEDASNADPHGASRNLLRLEVMPLLRSLNPKAEAHINAAAAQLAEIHGFLRQQVGGWLPYLDAVPGGVRIGAQHWQDVPQALRPLLLMEMAERLGTGKQDLGAVHIRAVQTLTATAKPGQLDLPHRLTVLWDGVHLTLTVRTACPGELPLSPYQPVDWGSYTLTLLDAPSGDGIRLVRRDGASLTVAGCPPGLRLLLPGAKGTRSVKRLCVDRGIPPAERDGLPAIYMDHHPASVWKLGTNLDFLPRDASCWFVQIKKRENHHEQ